MHLFTDAFTTVIFWIRHKFRTINLIVSSWQPDKDKDSVFCQLSAGCFPKSNYTWCHRSIVKQRVCLNGMLYYCGIFSMHPLDNMHIFYIHEYSDELKIRMHMTWPFFLLVIRKPWQDNSMLLAEMCKHCEIMPVFWKSRQCWQYIE